MGSTSSATSSPQIDFQDTSEFMYRDSDTWETGFTFEGGFTNENRNRNTNVTANDARVVEQLDVVCRTALKSSLLQFTTAFDTDFPLDRTHIIDRAHTAWNRAINLYPSFDANLQIQFADIETEFTNRVNQYLLTWQRTAGSSLNCLVGDMAIKAQAEISRRLAGVLAQALNGFRKEETAAIAEAFKEEFAAHHDVTKIGFGQIANLAGLLKGALSTDDLARTSTEGMNEGVTQIRAMGNYFDKVKSISTTDGSYSGEHGRISSGVSGVAGI